MTITDAMVEAARKAFWKNYDRPDDGNPGDGRRAMRAALEAAYPELMRENDHFSRLIAGLENENEALRKEIDSREAFWAELKKRLPETHARERGAAERK